MTVTFNSQKVLPDFLMSLREAYEGSLQLIVVDNSPSPSGEVRRMTLDSGGRYVRPRGNRGYGAAVNEAVRAIEGNVDWIAVANPDIIWANGSIDALIQAAESDSRIAAVGPRILNEDGSTYPSARSVPSLRNGVGHAILGRRWPANRWSRAYHLDDVATERRTAGWLSGACLLLRSSAFRDIGGFDESYFMYFEDVDLGYRFGKAGYLNLYEPRSHVTHLGGHSTNSAEMVRAHHESARRFVMRKYGGVRLAPLRAVLRAGLAFRSWVVTHRMS